MYKYYYKMILIKKIKLIIINVNNDNIRVMIQPQTLVQTYFVQTDVALIHWLNENIN